MINLNRKHFLSVLIIFATVTFASLTSCAKTDSDISSAKINSNGDLIVTFSDGSAKNLGAISLDKNTSVILESGAYDISVASNIGLTSAVSITAKFTKTEKKISGIFPGYKKSDYSTAGSGVIYKLDSQNGDAFIMTNYHVIHDSASDSGISQDISVFLYGRENEKYAITASYVGGSPNYDIAVLRIVRAPALQDSVYTQARIAEFDSATAGEPAIAIGNPEGGGISVSSGIVSVPSEYITVPSSDRKSSITQRVIRVDTAVNSGNSGGGLYNGSGQLIGIVNAKIVDDEVENIGYAIPIEIAVRAADNIIDNCYQKDCSSLMRASLGVSLSVSENRAAINTDTGFITLIEKVTISDVDNGGVAYGLLSVGDELISAKLGEEVISISKRYKLIDLMLKARPDDVISLTIERNSKIQTVEIKISENAFMAF